MVQKLYILYYEIFRKVSRTRDKEQFWYNETRGWEPKPNLIISNQCPTPLTKTEANKVVKNWPNLEIHLEDWNSVEAWVNR
jgi:hypothetical protein